MREASNQKPTDLGRRRFLTLDRSPPPALPWASADSIIDGCTRCGACVDACPQDIITHTPAGFPTVSFRDRGCTFCGACADACEEDIFDRDQPRPWALRATVDDRCIELSGIACRLCDDACDAAAIRFRPQLGGRTAVTIDADLCTGCGACVSRCPAAAIEVAPSRAKGAINGG